MTKRADRIVQLIAESRRLREIAQTDENIARQKAIAAQIERLSQEPGGLFGDESPEGEISRHDSEFGV